MSSRDTETTRPSEQAPVQEAQRPLPHRLLKGALRVVALVPPLWWSRWLSDRLARSPGRLVGRAWYRDPPKHRAAFDAALASLRLAPADRLLEIGCGGGGFLRRALELGCTAVGVDHSVSMLRIAARQNRGAVRAGRLRLVRADAGQLPFEPASFSAAALINVFQFLDDPVGVLHECVRVLGEEGRVAVVTVPPELRGTPAAPWPVAAHSRFYPDHELLALARSAGFRDARVRHLTDGAQLLVAERG